MTEAGLRSLEICELFRSIAGETTQAGRPAVFLRLAGCNLRCRWCDTQKSWGAGTPMPGAEVLRRLLTVPERLVVVTGGEPLLQPEVIPLCRELLSGGREVLLETNGSLDITGVPEGVRIILDLKAPGSGEERSNRLDNLGRLRPGDELKLVLCDRADFEWARGLLRDHPAPPGVARLFSPAFGLLEPGALAKWILEAGLDARLQVQLHRILWPQGEEGGSFPS